MSRITAESALRIHLARRGARHTHRALIRALLAARR
jgi:hypothetical protein